MQAKQILIVLSFLIVSTQAFRCPDPLSIQDPWLKTNFNVDQFLGEDAYYELALHDYTQPSICGCQRSVKTLSDTETTHIKDNFTMVCPYNNSYVKGNIQISDLSFNFTENKGVLNGHWNIAGSTVFPDTVVAVGKPDVEGLPYRWALEFQCVELLQHVVFIGVNFYSRDRVGPQADRAFEEMLQASQQSGIDQYWNTTSAGLRIINHTDCFY